MASVPSQQLLCDLECEGPLLFSTLVRLLNHPDSYGFPSHWHVRTYGLFAANPFGLKAFYKGAEGKDGTLVLAPGESFTLKYRVVLHPGDHDAELIEKQFKAYSGE